jgi:hypothetical protein
MGFQLPKIRKTDVFYPDPARTLSLVRDLAVNFGKWDLYSLCMSLTICSEMCTGSGVTGRVRMSLAPG